MRRKTVEESYNGGTTQPLSKASQSVHLRRRRAADGGEPGDGVQRDGAGTFTWQWWPEGPQKQDPAAEENYDEQGQLTLAYVTTTPGTIDPNNWWQAQTDALGHRMYHQRQTTAGVAYPLIDESTDGLRPETILDTQYSVLSGVRTLQGYRRYVLGPDPDEFLAWIDLDTAH
jgi:hypothetical protein